MDRFSKQEARRQNVNPEFASRPQSKKQNARSIVSKTNVSVDWTLTIIKIRGLSGVEVNDNRVSNRFLAFNLTYLL